MIHKRTAAEILKHALNQCAMFGAPPDMVANLRGALAFVSIGSEPGDSTPSLCITPLAETAPGATADE